MHTDTTISITDIIKAALFTPLSGNLWGLPLAFSGPPGVAKSALIEAVASRCGLPCETLSPGERGEGVLGVVPVPVKGLLTFPAADFVQRLEPRGVLFVDEILHAPPSVRPALLGLVHARRLGSRTLAGGVRILAAYNPTECGGGYDFDPPQANRHGHFSWPTPSVEDWGSWLLGEATDASPLCDPTAEEARVMSVWDAAFSSASALGVAFLRTRPELLHKMPADADPQRSRAWPSPRTWEFAVRAKAGAIVHGLTETEANLLVESFVGSGAAGEWFTYCAELDLPSPVDVLEGKVKFSHDPRRLDRSLAILTACAAYATKYPSYGNAAWGLLGEACGTAPDLAVSAAKVLISAGLNSSRCPDAAPVLAKLQPMLRMLSQALLNQ